MNLVGGDSKEVLSGDPAEVFHHCMRFEGTRVPLGRAALFQCQCEQEDRREPARVDCGHDECLKRRHEVPPRSWSLEVSLHRRSRCAVNWFTGPLLPTPRPRRHPPGREDRGLRPGPSRDLEKVRRLHVTPSSLITARARHHTQSPVLFFAVPRTSAGRALISDAGHAVMVVRSRQKAPSTATPHDQTAPQSASRTRVKWLSSMLRGPASDNSGNH